MPITDVLSVSSSLVAAPPAPPDTPRKYAFVAPAVPAGVTDVANEYSTLAEMEDDGWDTGDVAYNAMSRMLAQEPVSRAVSSVVIIKRGSAVANVWTIDIASTTDGNHTVSIGGVVAATFAASGSTTTQIKDGLVSAFNGGAYGTTHTAASTDTDSFTITADVAGIPFTPTAAAPGGTAPTVTETVDNVGVYDDLAAAFALIPFWGVYAPGALAVEQEEALRWVQADTATRRNFLFVDTNDVTVYDSGDTTSLAYEWYVARHPRVMTVSHPEATGYMAAAAIGKFGGGFPGSRAWHLSDLLGSTETTVTANRTSGETSTLSTRRIAYTERFFGPASDLMFTSVGYNVPSGHFIYQRHAEDWWWYTAQAAVFAAMSSDAGVNLNDEGLQGVCDVVSQAMIPLVVNGVIDDDFTVTYTAIEDVPAGEIAIGDFMTTGVITASATITPKLRSLAVTAEFAVV